MYHIIIGFLLGIIFSTVSFLYVFFRLLSKRVDPNLPKIKSSTKHQQQQPQQNQKHLKNTSKKSIFFSSSSEPFDFTIGKETPPTSIETCKWINFITKRLLNEINHSQQFSKHLHQFFNNLAEDESKPDFIGKLSFSDIYIGNTTPEIGTIKLISPINASVNVIEFDLIYSGDAHITASTELWLNWPQKHMACLPVKTKVFLKQFSGNFVLHIPNHTNPLCSLYLKEAPSLTLRMITKMGHETVLKEPGKIGSFIQNLIVKTLNQKVVTPNRVSFPLFNFIHPVVNNAALSILTHHQQQQQPINNNQKEHQHQHMNGTSSQPNSNHSTPVLHSTSPPSTQSSSLKQSSSTSSIASLSLASLPNKPLELPSTKKGIKQRKVKSSANINSTNITTTTHTNNINGSNSSSLSSSTSNLSVSAPASTQTSPTSSPAIPTLSPPPSSQLPTSSLSS